LLRMSANIVKKFLSGNEAISVGAYNAGCSVGTGYPGTPSTEILENFCKYDDVYSEWSVNEKVALEVGLGASLAGARTLVTMKHVGVNVAADPLFTAAYTGIKGGLVIVSADDPNLHSSQNEQDNRNYAKAAKIPALEPSDSQEAYDFTKLAFEISEKFDTPVFLRTTTRIAHSKGTAEYVDSREVLKHREFERNPKKYVMVPAFARERHFVVEDRIKLLAEYAETLDINKVEISNSKIGFITSGISYNYVKESYPDASFLKLGMIYPLPKKKISDFINKMDKVYIVEELDPFFETEIRSYGFTNVEGKKLFPITGEFSPDLIKSAITGEKVENYAIGVKVPPRLPALCPGCPHRTIFGMLRKYSPIITGDIGCYTLGVMPPFDSLDTCVDMGASITVAHGIDIVDNKRKIVSVIGDSTFAHSGITGLINAAYNKRNILVIVLDNGTTAMTGMQPNPFTGETIKREETFSLDYGKLAEAVGIDSDNFATVDAYKPVEVEAALSKLTKTKKLSLLVIKGPCVILKGKKKK